MKRLISSLFLVSLVSVMTLSPAALFAVSFNPIKETCSEAGQGTGTNSSNALCADAADNTDITGGESSLFSDVVNLLALAAGVIAVIMIIIAGISMMTSNGDAQKFQTARNTIIYTVIGIVVIVAARSIVIFIFNELTG